MQYKVKEWREKLGLSQEELAKRAGISRQIIVNLESDKAGNTTAITLKKIADALDLKISDIFS